MSVEQYDSNVKTVSTSDSVLVVETGNFNDITTNPSLNDQLVLNSETNNPDKSDSLQTAMLNFIGQCYANKTITNTVVQDITGQFISVVKTFSDAIKTRLPQEYHNRFLDLTNSNFLSSIDTDFKRKNILEKKSCLIRPVKFLLGNKLVKKKIFGKIKIATRKSYGYIIPMRYVLRKYLELPNVYSEIRKYLDEESKNINKGIYSSFFQGKRWKEILINFINKIVIPLWLYYDDFEINNALLNTAGIYKIGGLYYSFAGLPPKYASIIENVFLAQFIFSKDLKYFKNKKCFRRIIEELKFLAETGVTISVNGVKTQVYFVVAGILGDNLGINSILGFKESFNSTYFCRVCRASKSEAGTMCEKCENLIRNDENHKFDVENSSFGIKGECVFDEVTHFKFTKSPTCDSLHDWLLGIRRYLMARLIYHCIKEDYFTLDQLNSRLMYFDSSETDRGTKINSISSSHVESGYLKRATGAEMSFLISYFGIIVGDLVNPFDSVWLMYLYLFDIVDLINHSNFTRNDLVYLRQLIKVFNAAYQDEFEEKLKPKFHFATHYARIIEILGPVKFFSCQKFEAFHKLAKKYAFLVTSRLNILFTLSMKLQLDTAYRILCHSGFSDKKEYGCVIGKVSKCILTESEVYEISYFKLNGTLYKKKKMP